MNHRQDSAHLVIYHIKLRNNDAIYDLLFTTRGKIC